MRTFACLAATLDGKIASAKAPKERFGSKADLEHFLNTRIQADAILSGGETFRQFSGVRKASDSAHTPIQCILTRSVNLPPDASLFKKAETDLIPIIIFSPDRVPDEQRAHYPQGVSWVEVGTENPAARILETLVQRGVRTLSIEGGGLVVHQFLKEQLLQEMYLTLCPLFLGGQADPSLVSGEGFSIAQAPRTEMLSAEWKGQELYLHLKVLYSPSSD